MKTETQRLAEAIFEAADADGTVQADVVVRLAPTRVDLHSAIHWQRLADELGCRPELDDLAG